MKDLLATKDAWLEELGTKLTQLEELKSKITRLEELEVKVTQLETLELKVQKQEEEIVALRQDKRPANSFLSQLSIHPSGADDNNEKTAVAAAPMPKSCADLRYLGHTINGLYLIMGTEKVETVFCDFSLIPSDPSKINFQLIISNLQIHKFLNKTQLNICRCFIFIAGFETRIGYFDVKSSPVYFYFQRLYSYNTTNTPIPFDTELLNVGGAMNSTTGKFTAPRDGIYSFSFTGEAYIPASSSEVFLVVIMFLNGNGNGIGRAYENGTALQYETFSFQSTLNLVAGDKIWLEISYMSTGAYLMGGLFTQFSGHLLEQKIEIA